MIRKCVKQSYNPNMGMECVDDKGGIFFIDKKSWVKVGDTVEFEKDEKGFYRKIWVNGELKTVDHFIDKA